MEFKLYYFATIAVEIGNGHKRSFMLFTLDLFTSI